MNDTQVPTDSTAKLGDRLTHSEDSNFLNFSSFVINLLYLVIFWCLFSGEALDLPVIKIYTVFSVAFTLVFVSVFLRNSLADCGDWSGASVFYSPYFFLSLRFFGYAPFMVREVLLSGYSVLKVLLNPSRIDPVFEAITADNPDSVCIVENSITVTPGTIAVESNENSILVTAINQEVMDDLKSKIFTKKVEFFADFNKAILSKS